MYEKEILEYMKRLKQPIMIDEIAEKLGVSWQTAKTALLELAASGKIKAKKHKGSWVFWYEL